MCTFLAQRAPAAFLEFAPCVLLRSEYYHLETPTASRPSFGERDPALVIPAQEKQGAGIRALERLVAFTLCTLPDSPLPDPGDYHGKSSNNLNARVDGLARAEPMSGSTSRSDGGGAAALAVPEVTFAEAAVALERSLGSRLLRRVFAERDFRGSASLGRPGDDCQLSSGG
jgi:hypothetical protein